MSIFYFSPADESDDGESGDDTVDPDEPGIDLQDITNHNASF